MAKEYPLVEELQNNFIATDNIQRDDKLERSILTHAKVSFIIEYIAATTTLFPSLFKNSEKLVYENSCYFIPLEKPIVVTQNNAAGNWNYTFKYFEVYTQNIPKEDVFGQTGRWRLGVYKEYYGYHIKNCNIIWRSFSLPNTLSETINFGTPEKKSMVDFDFKKAIEEAIAEFSTMSKFELCQHLLRYDTPEIVCRRLGDINFKSRTFRQDYFNDQLKSNESQGFEVFCEKNPNFNEEDLVRSELGRFIYEHKRSIGLIPEFDKYYGPIKQVYSFMNEHNETEMKVVKLFEPKNQSKVFVPVTSWVVNCLSKKQYRCVPLLAKKQILYNLNLIEKKSTSRIIIADSIEIADANQETDSDDTVWTSFICEHEQYDQVDWEPLKENKEIFLLVTNHSNINLAEAYIKVYKLASFLKEKIKLELKFIQVQIDYPNGKNFRFESISDIRMHVVEHQPRITPNSVFIMDSFDEFEKCHEKAVESLQTRPRQFWEREIPDCSVVEQHDSKNKPREAIPFVFRPVILRGKVTVGHGSSGIGKTRFFLSMCASIVSGNQFIIGKSWNTVAKSTDKSSGKSGYKYRKVLYLDFESSQGDIPSLQSDFVDPYITGDDRERCKQNFVIKVLGADAIDYSEKNHHQKIIDMIDNTENNEGEKGQPLDLVVFDTYTSFVKNDHASAWNRCEELLKKITGRGIAVLLIAHTRENDKEVTGSIKKIQMCESEIVLSRKNGRDETLQYPMCVEMGKTRHVVLKWEKKKFEVYLENGMWCLWVMDEKLTDEELTDKELKKEKLRVEELKDFVITTELYNQERFQRKAVCQMLGIEKTTYSDRRKEFEEKFGKMKKYIKSNSLR